MRVTENLHVKLYYAHMRNDECSYWEWPGLTDRRKKMFICLNMQWLWSNCLPFCHRYPRTPRDGYNLSQFMALWLFLHHCRYYLLLEQHEYSSAWKCLSCPDTVVPSSQPWFLSECLPFSVGARSCGMPLLFSLTVPQQEICFFATSSNNSGEENKLSIYNL